MKKKRILALVLMAIIILSVPTFAADKIKVYTPDGRVANIYADQLQDWKNVGWYDYPVTRMYAPDGRTTVVSTNSVREWKNVGWYDYPVVKVYAPDGRTSVISKNALSSWKATGWYDHPVTRMYTLDGRTAVINSNQVQEWKNVGWYDYPAIRVYALDGRTTIISKNELQEWKNVGWYEIPVVRVYNINGETAAADKNYLDLLKTYGWYDYPVTQVFSLDGRTEIINMNQLQEWKNVGWYIEPMTKLYSLDGRTLIVPLDEATGHTRVGWYTLHNILFKAEKSVAEKFFGTFQGESYHYGTPQSGDISRMYYTGSPDSPLHGLLLAYDDDGDCVLISMKLTDVFPYLKLYADENGNITKKQLADALSDYGIYGLNYRMYIDGSGFNSYTQPRMINEVMYLMFDYDYKVIWVEADCNGNINLNTATCQMDIIV